MKIKLYQKLLLCTGISYCALLSGAYLFATHHEYKGNNPTPISYREESDYDLNIAKSRYMFCNNITLNNGFFDENIIRVFFSLSNYSYEDKYILKNIENFIEKEAKNYLSNKTYKIQNIDKFNIYTTLLHYFNIFREKKVTKENYEKLKNDLSDLNNSNNKLGSYIKAQHFFLIPILYEQAFQSIIMKEDTPIDTSLALNTLYNINTNLKYDYIPKSSNDYYKEIEKNMFRVQSLKEEVIKEKNNNINYEENIHKIQLICMTLHQCAEIGLKQKFNDKKKYKKLLLDITSILYDEK